jgi:hypothetical protein
MTSGIVSGAHLLGPDTDSTILITSGIKKLGTYGWAAMARNMGIERKGGEDKV